MARRIDKLFSGMPNVFGIADDIPIAGVSEIIPQQGVSIDPGQVQASKNYSPFWVYSAA